MEDISYNALEVLFKEENQLLGELNGVKLELRLGCCLVLWVKI
jgi:hypothetical protein